MIGFVTGPQVVIHQEKGLEYLRIVLGLRPGEVAEAGPLGTPACGDPRYCCSAVRQSASGGFARSFQKILLPPNLPKIFVNTAMRSVDLLRG